VGRTRGRLIAALSVLIGCGGSPSVPSIPEPSPVATASPSTLGDAPPASTPTPAASGGPTRVSGDPWPSSPGWHDVARVPAAPPRALAFDQRRSSLWLLDAEGTGLLSSEGDAIELAQTARSALVVNGNVGGLITEADELVIAVGDPRPAGPQARFIPLGEGIWDVLDVLGRSPADPGPPSYRGHPTASREERVRAAVVGDALLLVFSDRQGGLRRVAVPRLPLARSVDLLGVDQQDRAWLLLSPDPDVEPTALALVDARGRLVERATAPAGPNRLWAVDRAGRLAVARSTGAAVDLRLYVPGLGADLVRSP
jgi:hypothetical protein